jgi:hypothetical protein
MNINGIRIASTIAWTPLYFPLILEAPSYPCPIKLSQLIPITILSAENKKKNLYIIINKIF